MDILCVKCGEPWDAYGVNHGDMIAWEADMLRRGIGCPACKGVKKRNLTIMEHLENETATEGAGVEESNARYCPDVNYIELCHCDHEDCSNNIKINIDDIFYDGSVKIIYHSQGTVHFNNKQEIQNYAEYEHDWKLIDGNLYCKECAEAYAKCDCCGGFFDKEFMIFIQDEQCEYCEDCYAENYFYCDSCNNSIHIDDGIVWNDEYICKTCYEDITTTCDVCGKKFAKEDEIEGPNGECCCSEACADNATEKK
jgi:uncharacterized protein YbaR (Trm112 family)